MFYDPFEFQINKTKSVIIFILDIFMKYLACSFSFKSIIF